jgi:Cof subfamily protein (haloacid dehalogenase superfamily)
MPIRLIAIDIDGTLINSRWQVPEANKQALAEAVERGIEVVLVTGRRFDFARPVADQIPSDFHLIVNNGALIKAKDGTTLLRHLLPRATALEVLRATPEFRTGTAVVFDRPKARQVIFESLDFGDPAREAYYKRNSEYLAQVSPLEDCLDEDPIQVMFSGPFRTMRAAQNRLKALPFATGYSLTSTEYESKDFSILDVISRSASKGATLEEWARRLGIARENIMALGDNFNDHDMLEFAGLPVVMANSVPALKSRGWPVTLSNDESGVAAAIRTYAFGLSASK